MELSDEAKALCGLYKAVPIVGLIHKKTKMIVLAPCMPQKVILELNEAGEASSGVFKKDRSLLSSPQVAECNALLKKGYLPRVVYRPNSELEEISSHQLLFQQKCALTASSDWGGFTLTFDSLEQQYYYTFVSGAFNSPGGKREQGARLSPELQTEVMRQTAVLVDKPQHTSPTPQEVVSLPGIGLFAPQTPPRKRPCMRAELNNGSTLDAHTLGPN